MDMAEIKVPRTKLCEAKRAACDVCSAMTDNNIEIRLRFSLFDLILAVAGIMTFTAFICAVKKSCMKKKIRREAEKLKSEEDKELKE